MDNEAIIKNLDSHSTGRVEYSSASIDPWRINGVAHHHDGCKIIPDEDGARSCTCGLLTQLCFLRDWLNDLRDYGWSLIGVALYANFNEETKEPPLTQVELYEQALSAYHQLRRQADEQVSVVNNLWSKLTTEERQRFLG